MTPSGIEPVTFRLATQCLNQLRFGVPLFQIYADLKCSDEVHCTENGAIVNKELNTIHTNNTHIGKEPLFTRIRKIAKRELLVSSCPSVRPLEWNNSAPTGRIFMKFDI